VTVVFSGEVLAIEFRDGRPKEHIKVIPGQVDWDEPTDRTHRAINIGGVPYEEITIFFFTQPDDVARRTCLSIVSIASRCGFRAKANGRSRTGFQADSEDDSGMLGKYLLNGH
jgi:hypothetical protein